MLPQAVALKSDEATYLATDLSKVMVEMSKKSVASYIRKMGVETPVEVRSGQITYRKSSSKRLFLADFVAFSNLLNLLQSFCDNPLDSQANSHL